jgi:D-glycero-D-manno-heptose 1,7-bisphosphate phosphatase
VPKSIKLLNDAGFLVIVVTNQSGVARGFYDEPAVDILHAHIQQLLVGYGAKINAFYRCPHHPTEGIGDYRLDCDCRKGSPGMLLQAAREHGIDLARSFMIGDKVADVEAGIRAGCRPILVRTGYGSAEEPRVASQFPDTKVCGDLPAAVAFVLGVS